LFHASDYPAAVWPPLFLPAETGPSSLRPNPAQAAVIAQHRGHVLITAGPGTGKTDTLLRFLLRQLPRLQGKQRALVITFTQQAAEEWHARLQQANQADAERAEVGTCQAFCARFLREAGSDRQLLDPAGVRRAAQRVWPQISASQQRERLARLRLLKNRADWSFQIDAELCGLPTALAEAGQRDVDDLLLHAVELLRADPVLARRMRRRYRLICVDEYQDINPIQHALLRELVGDGNRLIAVGDPDQSIAGFGGSEVGLFHAFADDFADATCLRLVDNYRNAAPILQAAQAVVRQPEVLVPHVSGAAPIEVLECSDADGEARQIANQIAVLLNGADLTQVDGRVSARPYGLDDIAVLARTNEQLRRIERHLQQANIPVSNQLDLGLAEHPLAQALLAMLRLAEGRRVPVWDLLQQLGCDESEASAVVVDEQSEATAEAWAAWCVDERLSERSRQIIASAQDVLPAIAKASASRRLRKAGELFAAQPLLAPRLQQGVGAEVWHLLQRQLQVARSTDELACNLAVLQAKDHPLGRAERVHLLTLHAAKGLEFPVVIIAGLDDGLLPYRRGDDPVDHDEERRLFYVGLTRAKQRCLLTRADDRQRDGCGEDGRVSPFLSDIPAEVLRWRDCRREPEPVGVQLTWF